MHSYSKKSMISRYFTEAVTCLVPLNMVCNATICDCCTSSGHSLYLSVKLVRNPVKIGDKSTK